MVPILRFLAALCLLAAPAMAGDLVQCDTSIAGETRRFAYDPDSEGLKGSLSLRERLFGARGAITCPGLVTLRVMTPELTDAERAPFCLQWDAAQRSYIGYDLGERDAWLTCRKPRRSFCERVNRSKEAALRWAGVAQDLAVEAGTETVLHSAGIVAVKGPAAVLGEKLVTLGSTAAQGAGGTAALGAVAVTAVAVGGAIYVCSDSGAEAAAVEAAEVARPRRGEIVPGADLPPGEPVITTAPLPPGPGR